MKLARVTEEKKPGYPSFKDHTTKRRGLIKTALGGMLAILAAGCDVSSDQRTGGVIVAPQAPEESAPGKAPAAPSTANVMPLALPVAIDGDMAFPEPPAPQSEPPPALPGTPTPPAPPPPPSPEPPTRLLGEMIAPVPPKEPERPIATKGRMMAPRPPAAAEEK
jgi:hypothetical protein